MTDLETQLHSWAPRRPSRRLKQRLFPRPAPARPAAPPAAHFAWSWLAASAAAALVLVLVRLPHPALSPASAPRPFVAMALSNQATAATLSTIASNEQYSAPVPSLALTNLRPLTSSLSPRSLTVTTN